MFKTLGAQLRQPSGFTGRLVSRMMEMGNRRYYVNMIRELDLQNGEKIFEIGYGPGVGVNIIAGGDAGCIIEGIDFSELMYNTATRRNRKYIDRGVVSLNFGDLMGFDPPHSYDKIFCINVIYFWNDLKTVFVKIQGMLNERGLFCIYMMRPEDFENLKFTKDFNKHTVESVKAELIKAGFSKVEYKTDRGYYIRALK